MLTYTFIALLALAISIALVDWRKGWYAAILIGVLQDPIRKLTPGTPVIMVLSIMAVYAAIIFGAAASLQRGVSDFRRSYPRLYRLFQVFFLLLMVAAANGLMTFGLSQWKAPALGLFTYCAPLPAVILGYVFLRKEEDLLRFLKFYALLTSVALISVPLEYLRVDSPVLGTVALGDDWIRHLPGIQIRILSGIYRSPDIMAWHAAMVSIIALVLIIRYSFPRGWFWMGIFGWGFINCLLSGRRKMLYMIAVFMLVFLWRYWRRFSVPQLASFVAAVMVVWLVVTQLSTRSEGTQVYTIGARTTSGEVFRRLEGGLVETFRQTGILGAGLGSATQGARFLARETSLGWQEGGAGKLALELGLPGFLFVLYFAFIAARTMMRIAFARDQMGQLSVIRIALLGILAANVASFLVSHQPYTDGVLILMTAFLGGVLFATSHLVPSEAPVPESAARPAFRPAIPSPAQRSLPR